MNPTQSNCALKIGIFSFFLWGLSPLGWKMISYLPAETMIFNRAFFGIILLGGILAYQKKLKVFAVTVLQKRNAAYLVLSSAIIFVNWWIYLIGIKENHVTELSFAYFINPIFNIAIGTFFFKENLKPQDKVALGFIFIATGVHLMDFNSFPFFALGPAITFAAYVAVRKFCPVDSMMALIFESAVICVLSLLVSGAPTTTPELSAKVTVALVSMYTILPFVLYLTALKTLDINRLALFQYISPTLKLVLAVLVFGEYVSPIVWASFVLVWLGLVYKFSVDFKIHSNNRRFVVPPRA